MLRGNEKKNIFIDEQDKLRFIETIDQVKNGQRFNIYAFCIMDNHVHLMISEGTEEIARVMKRITVSYAYYFNKKYKRVGHLFQDRFKSEVVEEENYILSLARYIHQNPVKAGMVKSAGDYKWCSYNGYIDDKNYISKALDTEMILEIFSRNRVKAIKEFVIYMNKENEDTFIELKEIEEAVDEEEAKRIYESLLTQAGIKIEDGTECKIPNELVREFKSRTKLSNRKIAIITKINKEKVNKIVRNNVQ